MKLFNCLIFNFLTDKKTIISLLIYLEKRTRGGNWTAIEFQIGMLARL